jgi:hypothetical protein
VAQRRGKMKRSILVVLAATAALVLTAVGASARTSYSSTVTIVGDSGPANSDLYVYGNVASAHHACVANRIVKVYKSQPSGTTLVDTARTSDRGAWAAHGDFSASFGVKATVVRERIGRRHHHKICQSDSDTLPFF